VCVCVCVRAPGDDDGGAAVRGRRCGGQPGLRSPVPAVQLQFGHRDRPDRGGRAAAAARPRAGHLPAAGQRAPGASLRVLRCLCLGCLAPPPAPLSLCVMRNEARQVARAHVDIS